MRRFIVLVLCCSFLLGGCAALMREERERALDEAYSKNEINKVEYRSMKHNIRQEARPLGVPLK